jgi:2-keto-3-deoxy-L-fuconate dehydrogenase
VSRMQGLTAIVTGAAAGIGAAIATAYRTEGASVWVVDRAWDGEPEVGGMRLAADVADSASVERVVATTGPIDILVNCAGMVTTGSILDCSEQDWDESWRVNVTSMFLMIKTYLPHMLEAGSGSIVNIASVASSIKGVPARFAYSTSKAAVIGLTKSVAADTVGRGVRCNAIAPGTVDTPSWRLRAATGPDPAATRAAFVARQPMGRVGRPEEIAAIAVHLGSSESAFTTGTVMIADGGMSL